MLAVAVLGVLPEVLRDGPDEAVYVLAGYLAVHLAQHVFTPHFHFGEETHRLSRSAGISALLGLMLVTAVLSWFHGPRGKQRIEPFEIATLTATAASWIAWSTWIVLRM